MRKRGQDAKGYLAMRPLTRLITIVDRSPFYSFFIVYMRRALYSFANMAQITTPPKIPQANPRMQIMPKNASTVMMPLAMAKAPLHRSSIHITPFHIRIDCPRATQ